MADPNYEDNNLHVAEWDDHWSYDVANGETLQAGALVGVLASGYLDYWNNVATTNTPGVLLETVTGDTSGDVNVQGRVRHGCVIRNVAIAGSVTIADVGNKVYCQTGNFADLTKTAATSPAIGQIIGFRSASDCDIKLFGPDAF